MEDPSFNLTVEWTKDETADMRLIRCKREPSWPFVAGQVMILGKDGVGEAYFSIASAPEEKERIEFLVRRGKGMADFLMGVQSGEQIRCKGPVGRGFPINVYLGSDLLMAAVGSAIAPLRGVIRSILPRRSEFGNVKLVYGARTPSDIPLRDELKEWEQNGVAIMPIISKPEGSNWDGKTGHVQDYFAEALAGLDHPIALICGMQAMLTQSWDELKRLGIDPGDILTNY